VDKPKVTIAISFMNNERTLDEAILSVLNQTYSDWELILINDGSTDSSLDIAKKYADNRITLVSDNENQGLIRRLNQSVSMASGCYYARMDSDDIMHPKRIETQVKYLDSNPEVDLVDTGMYSIDENGRIIGKRPAGNSRKLSLESVLTGNAMRHATVMGRIEWFKVNKYHQEYIRAEDTELWCRTVRSSNFAHIEEPLYYVREGRVNIGNYKKSQKTARKIYKKYGPEVFGRLKIQVLLTISFFKEWMYTVSGIFDLQRRLTGRRNIMLNEREYEKAQQMMNNAIKEK